MPATPLRRRTTCSVRRRAPPASSTTIRTTATRHGRRSPSTRARSCEPSTPDRTGALRTVDNTRVPAVVTVTPEADPAKNNWDLTPAADTPPGGFASLTNQGYGAEISWNISELNMIPGHTYRLYFMVHDGDQNKTGGDVGQDCVFFVMPGAAPTATPSPTATATATATPTATPAVIAATSKTFSGKTVIVTFENN